MAKYITETTRGRTLHLLQLEGKFTNTGVYLNASNKIRDAERADRSSGYTTGIGPNTAMEIEKAREYADYVAGVASLENIHQYNCSGYMMFSSTDDH